MKNMRDAIMSIENQNTKMAILTTFDKLTEYTNKKQKNINVLNKEDIKDFLKTYYNDKSKTTIANTISNLKFLFNSIDKKSTMAGINLLTADKFLSIKKASYWTPSEIYEIVEQLENYQDRALILLCYLSLYDVHYTTIQNLKESDVHEDYINVKGKKVNITKYVYDILKRAMEETENMSYTTDRVYNLKEHTGYLLRNKKSNKIEQDKMSVTCLKRKLQHIGSYLGIADFTAVNIKNSRTIYDVVKLEYQYNCSLELNTLLIKDYAKSNNIKGCVELLNVEKKTKY